MPPVRHLGLGSTPVAAADVALAERKGQQIGTQGQNSAEAHVLRESHPSRLNPGHDDTVPATL